MNGADGRTLSLIERAAATFDVGEYLRGPGVIGPVAEASDATIPFNTELVEERSAFGPEDAFREAQGARTGEARVLPASALTSLPSLLSSAHRDTPYHSLSLPPNTNSTRVEAIDRARLARRGMIVPGAPIGGLAEEYRLVKRQLLLTADQLDGARARTILVGSARSGDGKTYSAVNLALSLAAERDIEVLLVDADFAKPDVMAELGLNEGPGLLDALADPDLDPEALVVRTDVPHLSLLPVGAKSHSDTELLASRRTEQVIARLLAADERRIIVFDTPPVLGASPASVLALHVGQVMLVVRADRTTENDVRRAVALLDRCEHIQLVLNAVSFALGGDRFGSYYDQGG